MAESVILYNKRVTPSHFMMGLKWKGVTVLPGQFVMVKITPGYDPLLRRPFGIYGVIGAAKSARFKFKGSGIEIVYKVVGKGTSMLAELAPGEKVELLGPLGNGFPAPARNEKLLMVAGGIGIAPFKLGAVRNPDSTFLFGARDKKEAKLALDIKRLGVRTLISTDDGSTGTKGFVTELLKRELTRELERNVVHACGPLPMLKAVAEICMERGVPCYVSLERSMACGVGACLGCAVKVGCCGGCKPGEFEDNEDGTLKMVCSDGPVFDAETIKWESF